MKKIKQLAAMCTLAVAATATFTASAKTCTWTAQSGNWADSANWADGAVPEDGDSVELVGSGSGGVIQLQGGATAALAGILNAESSSGWTLTDGTVNWADGTVVLENAGNFKVSAQLASPDTTTFVKRGAGSLFLYTTNTALRCAFVVEGGRILPVDDLSFGVVPETLRADAITLRGGTLFNGDAGNLVTIAPTRGVTVDGLRGTSSRSRRRAASRWMASGISLGGPRIRSSSPRRSRGTATCAFSSKAAPCASTPPTPTRARPCSATRSIRSGSTLLSISPLARTARCPRRHV